MEFFNSNNAIIMEKPNNIILTQLINTYVSSLNNCDILSKEDKLEVTDHLMSESENLLATGLNTEEAFAIAKMRFGDTPTIEQEYKKVKPWSGVLRACTYTLMVMLIIQSYLLISHVLKISFWYALGEKKSFLDNMFVTNMIIQLIVAILLIWILAKSRLISFFKEPSRLWFFPILYFIVIIAQRAINFFQYGIRAHFITDVNLLGDIFLTKNIASLLVWSLMSLVVLIYLKKQKKILAIK